MVIQNFQDKAIRTFYPSYNREKSHIVFEGGNERNMDFIVKIYRKGTYRFTIEGGVVTASKRIV